MTITARSVQHIFGLRSMISALCAVSVLFSAGSLYAMQPNAHSNGIPVQGSQQEFLNSLKVKKRAERLMDYFIPVAINTVTNAAMAFEQGGSAAVVPYVLKPTAIDIAKDGSKYAGKKMVMKLLKNGLSVAPHNGQKKVVGWGVGGLVNGAEYYLAYDKNPNWFSRFILQRWLPSFVKSQVVHFAYKTAVTATGADYPEFVQKRDWMHHLAKILIPTYAHMALSFAYEHAFNYFTQPKISATA